MKLGDAAGLVDDVTIYGAVGIDRRTHVAYEQILRNIYAVDLVPAWTSNRLKRLVLAPKRYVVDPALMAASARIGRLDVIDDAGLLGRLIDTFVVAEIRARHLLWLEEQLGDRVMGGVVFHTGPAPIEFGRNVLALPICSLWADPS